MTSLAGIAASNSQNGDSSNKNGSVNHRKVGTKWIQHDTTELKLPCFGTLFSQGDEGNEGCDCDQPQKEDPPWPDQCLR